MGSTRRLVSPDENHWILEGENSRVFYLEMRAWLERYLLGGAATAAEAVAAKVPVR